MLGQLRRPLFTGVVSGLFLVATHARGAEPALPGNELYTSCASCHGANGEGSEKFGAPTIAGQPVWYLEAQLQKFRTNLRAYHPDDADGLRMRPMARTLKNDTEVKTVANYIAQMKPVSAKATLKGANVEKGKAAYAVCVACHGPSAGGNEALRAPALAGQHDWYLVSQLRKFKAGLRGTAPGDITGAQMRPMSMTLADEQAMRDVTAYITSLAR